MVNEFRVKEGLIVDGVTDSGVNPVTISDAVISSASALEVRSTANADPSILIHSNGGDDETIKIRSNQGTGADSIILVSDEGGITLDAELDIALDANGGDVFVKDDGAVYGSLTNSSGALHIYSGTAAVLKMGTNSVVSNASFMGDLTVGGTAQTGSAANRLQVNSPSGSAETVEARIRTSIETPSTIAGVSNVLVLDNGNKASIAAQGMVTTIGSSAATDQNTQAWFWGRMDSYNVYSLGYVGGKHWDTSGFAGSSTSPEKAAQSLFQVDSTGRILVGAANGEAVGTEGPQNMVTVFIDDDDGQDGMTFLRQDESTSSGDLLGAIGFDSADGNMPSLATEASAYIAAYATEAHAIGNKGGALVFGVTHLTDDDDTTSQEVMRISSDSATSAFVQISNVNDSGGELRFMEDTDDNTSSATQYAAFKAQAMAASYTMILPNAKGTAGQVLDIASVSGTEITLAWDDVSGGGGDVTAGSSFNTAGVLMAANGGGAKEIDVPGTTLTTNGQGLTVGGATIVQPGSSGGVALTLTATDVDQIALDINASNTTANVLDIAANAVTEASVIEISANALTSGEIFKAHSSSVTPADGGTSKLVDFAFTNDSTNSQTAYGLLMDYNKTGLTASGKTATVYGIMVDIDDNQTNDSNATVTQYGAHLSAVSSNDTGAITNIGVHAVASGGDNNYAGIFEGVVGIGTTSPDFDLQVESSASTGPVINIKNTNTANNGGELRFWLADSGNGANGDILGTMSFYGNDGGGADQVFANIIAKTSDVTADAEEGKLEFQVATQGSNGSVETVLTIDGGANAAGSTVEVAGSLSVSGDLNITGDINSVSVTNLDVDDLTITVAKGASDSAAADGAGIVVDGASASLLYDDTGTQWEFNKNVEFAGHILPNADDTYDIGSSTLAWQDLFLEGDITLTDAGTLQTSAGALTITAAAASTWSTSAGALTLTSAAACTWSAAAGDLTLDSAAGTANLDGHTGVQITSSNSGNIDLESVADIVLDVADNKHVFFQEGGVTHSAIAHGTVEIADLAGTANATAIDVFDCTVFQAVKYFILVEDRVADHYMTTEILVLGDDNGGSAATAVMTTYAVLFNEAELGVFTVAGSGNNITLSYNPSDQDGSDQHRVRVVANRIASLSDTGQ